MFVLDYLARVTTCVAIILSRPVMEGPVSVLFSASNEVLTVIGCLIFLRKDMWKMRSHANRVLFSRSFQWIQS